MKLEEIKKLYKDEWVLVEVLEVDEAGEPTEVNLIAHSKNRDETYAEMKKTEAKHISHFYTGKIPKKGYAVAFKWAGLSFLRDFNINLNFKEGILEIN